MVSQCDVYFAHAKWVMGMNVVKTLNEMRAMFRYNPCLRSLRVVFSPFVLFGLYCRDTTGWFGTGVWFGRPFPAFYCIRWSYFLYTHKHFTT